MSKQVPNNARRMTMNIDKDLHRELKQIAEAERRDITAQIHIMLYEMLEQRKSKA